MAQIFNTEVQAAISTDGGSIGYSNGSYLGGLVPVDVNANTTVDWTYLGKLLLVHTTTGPVTVTLPATSGYDGMMVPVQRDGSNLVMVATPGGSTITLDNDSAWVIFYCDESADTWRVLNVSGQTYVDINSTHGLDFSKSGTGTQSDPIIFTPSIVLDPNPDNLLSKGAAGLMAKVFVGGSGISGKGTADDPIVIESVALARVRVVADLASRDAAFSNPAVTEGDVAKVTTGENGLPQTFIRDGSGNWVEIEDRDSVLSVNGQTGNVVLGIAQMNDVDLTGLANGQFLAWSGTQWVPTSIPVNSYVGQATPTFSGVNITHGLGVATVHCTARNTTTGDYEVVSFKRVDDNTMQVKAIVPTLYEFRFSKGTTN